MASLRPSARPWITVVALKNIAAEVDGERSVPGVASAMTWDGAGLGGIVMQAVSPIGSACV